MPANRAYHLAADHWSYNEKVLKAALLVSQADANEEFIDKILYLCKTLYIESAVHFYGHAQEDISSVQTNQGDK